MKRFISIALALVLAGGLTACSGGGDKQAATKAPEAAATEGTTKAMEQGSTEGTAKDVTITVFHYMTQTTKQEGLKAVEEAFAGEHPEYQITWDNVFYNQGTDYFPQLQTALASGDQPEVIMGNPGLYPDLVTEGYAADLTDNAVIKGLNLPSGDLGDVSHDGKIYGFPIDFKTWGVFYNKKIFADNGIEEPKTYTELLAACEKLDAAGIDPWAHAFNDAVFGDIEMRNYIWTNDQNAALEVFVSGEAAMMYFGTWGIGDLESMIEGKDFEYGFFVEPIDDEGSAKLNVQVDQSFMLNPQAENYDVALEFMEYWVQNGGDSWSAISLMPLLNGSAASNAPEVVQTLAKLKASGDISHYGDFTAPFNSQFTSAWRTYLTAFAESYSNGTKQSAKQCLDDMQAKFDQIIAEQ